jgi:altronate hydrolase
MTVPPAPRQPADPAVAIVLDERDCVAVLTRDAEPGQAVSAGGAPLTAAELIPRGHKIARRDIAAGQPVRKYGEVIGRATTAIAAGAHVHVHNLHSARLPGPPGAQP